MSSGRPRGRPLVAAARWVTLALVLVVTIELTCRVEDWVRYRIPFSSPVTRSADLVLRDAAGPRGRPNARFGKWHLNRLGFRGPEIAATKPAGTIRVATAGASETFGLYESDGREYPRQLADSLNARIRGACRAPAPPRFETINAALPGMSLPSLDRFLREQVAPLGVDVVVIYPTPGFYLNRIQPFVMPPDGRPGAGVLSPRRALTPRAVGRFRDQFKAIAPDALLSFFRRRDIEREIRRRGGPEWVFEDVPADRVDAFDQHLRRVVGTARSIGAVPVLATNVNVTLDPRFDDPALLLAWRRQFPRATERVIVDFHARAAEVTLRVAADSATRLVDLRPLYRSSWRRNFSDFVHFTDAGAGVIAGALATAVSEVSGVPAACLSRREASP